ncbi:MAG: acyl carrier protein [Prevotella sp.]|nr:acyl carrier protein [Prevotella sp.]MBR6190882.1 acyl carrier protein [Prevotella sp.]
MDINSFIENFAGQFADLSSELTPETKFRELPEWTSLEALLVLSMIDEEYDVVLKPEEMRKAGTIQDLYELTASKIG